MTMRGVDHDAIDAGVDQHERALEPMVADGRGGGDPEPSLGILAGGRMQGRLFHVLDGDEADAAEILVDDDQLFEAMLMQQPARLVLAYAFPDGDEIFGHQFADRLQGIVGEADIAVGQYAAEPRRLAARSALDHRNPRNPMPAHQRERIGERFIGKNRDRIDHHAAFVALDLAHLLGLFGGRRNCDE